MAAANDRLISVVSIEMQPAPCKDERENVASGGYPLAVLAANSTAKSTLFITPEPVFCCSARKFAVSETNKQSQARSEPDWR